MRPEFQRSGVGRALLAELLERYQHCRQFVLITERGDARANAFYRSLGLLDGEQSGTAVFLKLS